MLPTSHENLARIGVTCVRKLKLPKSFVYLCEFSLLFRMLFCASLKQAIYKLTRKMVDGCSHSSLGATVISFNFRTTTESVQCYWCLGGRGGGGGSGNPLQVATHMQTVHERPIVAMLG